MSSDDSKTSDMSFIVDPAGYLRRQPRARKRLIRAAWLAAVLLILLTLLPIAAAWYAEDWLRANGAADAVIDDIDINVFTGEVRITGLDASAADARLHVGLLEANAHWWPLAWQRVHIQEVHLTDSRIDVRAGADGSWQIGGLNFAPAATSSDPETAANDESSPWHFGSERVHLTDVELTYRDQLVESEVDIDEILLGSHFSWEHGLTTDLDVDMTVDGARLRLSSEVQPWADERSIAGTLDLDALDLAEYRTLLERAAGVLEPRGTIDMDLELHVTHGSGGELKLGLAGPVQIDNVGFALGDLSVENESLRWDGEVSAQLPASIDAPLVTADGTLSARNGEARHTGLGVVLGAYEQLALNELVVQDVDQVSLAQINLQALRLLSAGNADAADVFTLDAAIAERVDYSAENGLVVDRVRLQQPRANVQRDAEGKLVNVDDVLAAFTSAEVPETTPQETVATADADAAAEPDAEAETETETETEIETETEAEAPTDDEAVTPDDAQSPSETSPAPQTAPLPFRIGRVEIRADEWLSFEDRAVTPTAVVNLTALTLDIDNIDSRGETPANLELKTGNDTLKIAAAGTVDGFSEAPGVALSLQVANLDLPPFSPYVPGYNVERGRFATDTSIRIEGDALDISNALVIERLQLAGKAAEGTDVLAEGMAMPLDVALDLLRDGEDRIQLELPVTGSLSDPEFGTGDIVRKAMQSAVQSAAMSYVKNALQPLGTILLVRDLAKKASRPRFAPVEMTPGNATLPAVGREYFDKIGTLLAERPGLQLTLCGVAAPADREALLAMQAAALAAATETAESAGAEPAAPDVPVAPSATPPAITEAELITLAEARTTAAIDYLAEKAEIDRSRLFACRATFADTDEALPSIDISL